jgi:DNA-binding GntR family transcriptional regulator
MIDPRSPRAIYLQVADDLREQITTGQLVAGNELLPERALASRYGVGVDTVQRALAVLVRDGYVEKRRGHASTVRHTRPMARVRVDMDGREIGARGATEAEAAEHGVAVGAPMLVLYDVQEQADGSVQSLEVEAWPAEWTRLRRQGD